MTWQDALAGTPWSHDLLATLRRIEALNPDLPRIGDSAVRRDEVIDLGQMPHLDFPASNVARFRKADQGAKAQLLQKFMGMLGPMGPLPLHTTEEALEWFARRDDAFCRFLDIFNGRFLQLFYRAFADARPGEQAVRPRDDRFAVYVGAASGVGGGIWRGLDTMPDLQKLAFSGLLGARTLSASRIEYLVSGVFRLRAEVDQFIGTTLPIGPDEQTRLGRQHAQLGAGALLGAQVISVDHKFRLRLYAPSLEIYERFLPGGQWCQRLVDTLAYAVGQEYDWDVELVVDEPQIRPVSLGRYGRLGWTGWMRRPAGATGQVSTRFSPAALMTA